MNNSIKPLIISWSDIGGAGIAARRIHQALRRNDIQSTMLVMIKKSEDPSIIQIPATCAGTTDTSFSDNDTTSFRVIQNQRRWQNIKRIYPNHETDMRYFSDVFSDIELHFCKEVQDAEVINIHWVAGMINYDDLPFAFADKPIFWTLHDMNPFTGGCHYNNDCMNYLTKCGKCPQLGSEDEQDITRNSFLTKERAIRNLDLNIITPSYWLGGCSQNSNMLGNFPHHVVHNCLPLETFKPLPQAVIREKYKLHKDTFIVLAGTVSFQDKRKGFKYLLQALHKLRISDLTKPITLVLYGLLEGDPPDLPNGINLLSLGYISDTEKMVEAYNLADVFTIPSLEDNLPNVVIEAMACGTPVIGFRTGGIPDMIRHKKNGYLVEQKDIDGLVEGIKWVLSQDQEKRGKTREYCRQWVLETFSEKVIAEQYFKLFEQAVQKKRMSLNFLEQGISNKSASTKNELLKKARISNRFSPEILREEALLAVQKGDKTEAKNLLKEALDHAPGKAMSLLAYGTILDNDDQSDEDFILRASSYLDKFPDHKGVRNLVVRNQARYWQELANRIQEETLANDSNKPLVTIILVCSKNNFRDLETTLQSVCISNPDSCLEVLLINFTGTRITETITFPRPITKLNIRIFDLDTQESFSPALAANLGMTKGSSDLCMILNAGDQLSNISTLIAELEQNTTLAAAYGNSLLVTRDKDRWPGLPKLGDFFLLEPGLTDFNHLKHNYSVGPHPLWRRNLCHEIGYWDMRLKMHADQDFWLRICREKKIRYLPVITGKAITNDKWGHSIPDNLKQSPDLTRRYRSLTAASPKALKQRQNDILKYVNNNLEGLNRFLSELTRLLEKGDYFAALHLYDRIRWDMLPNPELAKVDSTINKLRHSISASQSAPAEETANQLLQKATQAIANSDDLKAFNLLNKIKSMKAPIQNTDYLRAEIFIRVCQPMTAKQALLEELRYFPENFQAKILLDQLDEKFPQGLITNLGDSFFQGIYRTIRPYTMLSEKRLLSLYQLARKICEQSIPGNFIECGVAAGGSTALLAAVIKRFSTQPRRVFAFDSFSGMPEPGEHDKSGQREANETGWGTGTCAAPESSVREICQTIGVGELVTTVKGYFQETLPANRDRVGMIAMLHLDGDWYDSTAQILENLFDRVVAGGILQIDDYGHWSGCRKAVHEFADQHNLQFDINNIDGTGVWVRKETGFSPNPLLDKKILSDFKQIDPVKQGISSQMSANERFQLFYTLTKHVLPDHDPNDNLHFIEIGSFSGASLSLFYLTLKQAGINFSGFCVEPAGTKQFYKTIKQMHPEITHIKNFSHQAVNKIKENYAHQNCLAQFMFVDGDHSYQGVCQDIRNYYPLLANGGYMIFHDFLPELNEINREAILSHHGGQEPGIRQACQELMEKEYGCKSVEIPLLYPDDPSQTQAHLPIIPGVFSTIKVYNKIQ